MARKALSKPLLLRIVEIRLVELFFYIREVLLKAFMYTEISSFLDLYKYHGALVLEGDFTAKQTSASGTSLTDGLCIIWKISFFLLLFWLENLSTVLPVIAWRDLFEQILWRASTVSCSKVIGFSNF